MLELESKLGFAISWFMLKALQLIIFFNIFWLL